MDQLAKLDLKDIKKNINNAILFCKSIKETILKDSNLLMAHKDYKSIMLKFYEIMYIINYYYSVSGLIKIVMTDNDSSIIEKNINEYMEDFYLNDNIYSIIIKIIKFGDMTNEEYSFFNKLIKKIKEKRSSDLCKIKENINILTAKIHAILDTTYTIYIPDKLLVDQNDRNIIRSNNIKINRLTYMSLQKKVRNSYTRSYIENEFLKKINECTSDLSSLLILRQNYAEYFGYKTVFEQHSKANADDESKEIKALIHDLILKINDRSAKEIDRVKRELYKDGFNKKVDNHDILYYYEKLKSRNKYSFKNVSTVLFDVIYRYFGISIKKSQRQENVWDQSVIQYDVTIDGFFIGVLYFDVIERKNKLNVPPTYLVISHRYSKNISRVAFIASYKNVDINAISYNEIIHIFREFGYILHNIVKNSVTGQWSYDNEYDNLMPQIMEYIAWEKLTVKQLCNDVSNDETFVDHILFMRYINFATTIKNRCINVLYDHVVHNSTNVIKLLRSQDSKIVLLDIYKKIYKDIMGSNDTISEIMNLDTEFLSIKLISSLIDGSEGMLYANILCEILSYNVYNIISNGDNKSFIKNVIMNNDLPIRKSIHNFVSKSNIGSYNLYLADVVGYSEIDTEINKKEIIKYDNTECMDSDTNYYDDNETEEIIENILS